jgi:hypothetical protein
MCSLLTRQGEWSKMVQSPGNTKGKRVEGAIDSDRRGSRALAESTEDDLLHGDEAAARSSR